MSFNASRKGFTLIELLIVVVIIGLLAAISIPKFQNTRGRAHIATMQADLKNLSTAQEGYFVLNTRYATNLAGVSFRPSANVTVEILEGTEQGWSAKATLGAANCVVFYGQATPVSPATREGVIACEE